MVDGSDGRGGAGRVEIPPGGLVPVAGAAEAAGRATCGFSASLGRSLEGAGRMGIAGTAEVPGADGSSIRKRILGGTTRPGMCGGGLGGAGFGTAAGAVVIGVSRTTGSGSAAAI